jgi:hypothetical protein
MCCSFKISDGSKLLAVKNILLFNILIIALLNLFWKPNRKPFI